jgi:hypothetical protein
MYYGKQMRAVGDEYDMDPREEAEAKLLQLLGKIEIVTSPAATISVAPSYSIAAEEPEAAHEEASQRDSRPANVSSSRYEGRGEATRLRNHTVKVGCAGNYAAERMEQNFGSPFWGTGSWFR